MAEYHSKDFDFHEHALHCTNNRVLPEISPYIVDASNESESNENEWDQFYTNHVTGKVYKPRRYLEKEFFKYREMCHCAQSSMTHIAHHLL